MIDIVATRTKNERGQAWIVFSDVASATRAMQAMNDFPFYDKPMRIAYSHEKSHATLKLEGTFKPGQNSGDSKKRQRDEETVAEGESSTSGQSWRKTKIGKMENANIQSAKAEKTHSNFLPTLPSKMLLVQGLTQGADSEATKTLLSGLFGVFHGLTDIRVVAERGLAFVEFVNESAATPALQALHNYKVSINQTLDVKYASTR